MTTPDTDIIKALQLDELSQEEQEEILLDLDELITTSVIERLTEEMSPEAQAHFELLLESDTSDEKLQAFLQKNVPNADQIVEEVTRQIRDDIMLVSSS